MCTFFQVRYVDMEILQPPPIPSEEGVANDRTTLALCLGAEENTLFD